MHWRPIKLLYYYGGQLNFSTTLKNQPKVCRWGFGGRSGAGEGLGKVC